MKTQHNGKYPQESHSYLPINRTINPYASQGEQETVTKVRRTNKNHPRAIS